MNAQPRNRKWIQIGLVLFLVLSFSLLAYSYFSQYRQFNSENLQKFVDGFGTWAIPAYIAVYLIGSPVPMLSTVFSAAGGLLFGPVAGPFIVIGTATLSSMIPFMLARSLGRDWVEARLQGKKLEEFYERSDGGRGFTFILLMRLIPVIPWEIQNYIAGVTRISVGTFLLATVLGILPLSTALVLLGASVRNPGSWQFFAAIGLTAATMLIPILIMAVSQRRKKEMQ